ncbi:MBL fold metallo-hydrolase [Nocardioides ferulae]|uniref:MBL fold metallo-hydrolase n=1 Tax=Nocardioides ferulae TaxID=2340821 RepID=UPI000EAF1509|nr:MBL fold metallo-hydrolase [Nocardioides ferulae]
MPDPSDLSQRAPAPDSGFHEVADRIWVARYAWWDVNVTAIGGSDGLLVVDTHSSAAAARRVVDDVRGLGAGEVVALVNTHEHFDHVFGNGTFRAAYGDVPIHAHEVAAANTVPSGLRDREQLYGDPADPHHDEVFATEIVPADHTFSSALALDLGDRFVELVHPGRGHTEGDLIVRVPDADVLLAGDLVEETATDGVAVPGLGDDCFPMDWPLSLDVVLALTTDSSVVVPGHGAPVGRDFVEEQRGLLGVVAETIRDLASRGVQLDQALDAAEWPWPQEHLRKAVERGYAQLPRSQKRLPLV